jgi:hypothetical protein
VNHEFLFTYETELDETVEECLPKLGDKDEGEASDDASSVATETDEREYENVVAKFNRFCLRYSEA